MGDAETNSTPCAVFNHPPRRRRCRPWQTGGVQKPSSDQRSSFVHAALALLEATTASMNAIPRMPSSIFG